YQISRSLRFNASDSAYCSYVAVTPTDATKFTLSFWIKRNKLGTEQAIMYSGLDASNKLDRIAFLSGDTIELRQRRSNVDYTSVTNAVFRDVSAWYHIVYSWNAGARTLYVNGVSQSFASSSTTATTHYWQTSGRTLYIGRDNNEGGSPYAYGDFMLADVFFIDGQALTPSSFTETDATTGQLIPKAYTGSYGTNGFHLEFADNSAATATTLGKDTSPNGNNWTPNNLSVTASNYNTLVSATASGGVRNDLPKSNAFDNSLSTYCSSTTSGSSEGEVSLSFSFSSIPVAVSSTVRVYFNQGSSGIPNCRKARINGGSYVANGSTDYAQFSFSGSLTSIDSTLGSGTGGGFSATIAAIDVDGVRLVSSPSIDSLVDVPTNGAQTDTGVGGEVRGNYCTFNPIARSGMSNATLANGNLDISGTGANYTGNVGTIALATGKYYWEYTVTATGDASGVGIIATGSLSGAVGPGYGFAQVSDAWIRMATVVNSNSTNAVTGLSSIGANDVVNVAVDIDAGKLWFGRNGTWESSGAPASGTNATVTFTPGGKSFYPCAQGVGTWSGVFNAGARSFAYTAPSGFKALCTANLPAPSVTKPSTVMDVLLYTGNGATPRSITGLNFSPDLVWTKKRSASGGHGIFDVIRGSNPLASNNTADETTNAQYGRMSSFDSAGFTVMDGTAGSAQNDIVNANGATYVAWTWDAGSSTVTNTAGSITSSVRANATAGF
ncbi:hypothetical protein EBZ39_14780, partial [bacterium]|nr:hypothetical protein [bacterium]